jgi:hypothetical protein
MLRPAGEVVLTDGTRRVLGWLNVKWTAARSLRTASRGGFPLNEGEQSLQFDLLVDSLPQHEQEANG